MWVTSLINKNRIFSCLLILILVLNGCSAIYGDDGEETSTDDLEIVFKPSSDLTDNTNSENSNEPESTPTVIIVEESELVKLKPKAEDPDDDELIFTYTTPLDENGEWQTSLGDSGEYTVTVTVSDGIDSDSQDVLLLIKKKEVPPTILESSPVELSLTVDENEEIDFSISAQDSNDDSLTYEWKLDGNVVSDDVTFSYTPSFDDEGSHTLKVDISDGNTIVNKIWSITVLDINRPSEFEGLEDVSVKENEIATILVFASDEDGDNLEFSVDDSRFEKVADNEFEWETDYDSQGEYLVKVSIFDGTNTMTEEITVTVENQNRKPKIIGFEQN